MLSDAWFLIRNDLRYLFRSKETILWTFLMPPLFFYFIGTVTGGNRMGPGGGQADEIAVVAPGGNCGWLGEEFVKRLESRGLKVTRVSSEEEAAGKTRRLVLPADFTGKVLAGEQAVVRLVRNGGGIDADYDELRVKIAAAQVLADLVLAAQTGDPTEQAVQAIEAKPRLLTLKTETAGRLQIAPSGFQQAVPGTMVMFTLLILFTTGSVSLMMERHQGILRRLASSPMSRGSVVVGKWGSRWVLGLVQIAFAMAVGAVVFHVRWGSVVTVAVLMMAYSGLIAFLGVLLGNFGQTIGQVTGIGIVAANLFGALGGCWWPIEVTPFWAQRLAMCTPTGWAMDALHKVMNFGDPISAVLPHLAAMGVSAVAAAWFTARRFRFQ